MATYFVAHTQPNCERRAINHLRSLSFSVYCPMTLVERFHARKREYVPRPFLPRYLFVQDDGRGVSQIKRANGMHDVVRAGLEPVRAQQVVIDRLQQRELNGYIDLRETPLPSSFRKGELVRVTDGPFEGYNALFQRMRGETRALVFLTLLIRGGGQIEAEVKVSDLERAA